MAHKLILSQIKISLHCQNFLKMVKLFIHQQDILQLNHFIKENLRILKWLIILKMMT
jgi:hypothetical protein